VLAQAQAATAQNETPPLLWRKGHHQQSSIFGGTIMDSRVVRLGNLEEFTAEVRISPPGRATSQTLGKPVVRLHLVDRSSNGRGLPAKVLELHLQGLNDVGEIVWLMESHEITWLPDQGPATPREQSIYEQMLRLRDLVKDHLEGLGYEVRNGSYGLHKDIQPIRGQFECARWRKAGDERYEVVSVADEGEVTDGQQ
jgi:hypothetical protein